MNGSRIEKRINKYVTIFGFFLEKSWSFF